MPHTDTVPGGFKETEQVFYLLKGYCLGRKIIGADLNEVGVSRSEWDENVGSKTLFKLCNLLVASILNTENYSLYKFVFEKERKDTELILIQAILVIAAVAALFTGYNNYQALGYISFCIIINYRIFVKA